MKEPSFSPSNLQPGTICGFFDKNSFRLGLVTAVQDNYCRVAGPDGEMHLPVARLVLTGSQIYPCHTPAEVLSAFCAETDACRSKISLADIRSRMSALGADCTLDELVDCLADSSDACRFALFLALREQPSRFRIKKGLYHALTVEEELAWFAEEERRELQKLDAAACPLLSKKAMPVLFTPALLQEAERSGEYDSAPCRTDLTGLRCWTIDAQSTRDLDDAISLQESRDGWELGIHITDVSSFIGIDSALDREANRRTASVYLPQLDVHMLPESLSCGKASLLQGSLRPALSIICGVDSTGQIVSCQAFPSQIKVSENYSYEQFEAFLSSGHNADNPAMGESARVLQIITEMHLQKRIRDGAAVREEEALSPARRLVAECMVIYNSRLAELARATGESLFYRYLETPDSGSGHANDYPHHVPPAVLGTLPRPHAGMGLPAYAQFSSPLRRYADLVNQRQILAILQGSRLPYSREELEQMLPHLSGTRQLIRQVTRQAEADFAAKKPAV